MGNISFIAINIIFHRLGAAIRKKHMVFTRGVVAISLLIVAKMDLLVIIFHSIAVLVIGGMVFMVLLMVVSQSNGDCGSDQNNQNLR